MARAARVSATGKKEGEEEQVVAGSLFILQGGPWSEGAVVEAVVGRGHGARDPPVATVTKVLTGEAHCQGFILFPFSRKTSRV